MTPTKSTVLCFDKYVYIMVIIMSFNDSTTAVICSISMAKCLLPWRFIRAWNSESDNYLPLSICRRRGWRRCATVSNCMNAAVIPLAFLEWTGIAQANSENTSITVRRYLIQPFYLAIPAYRLGPPAIKHRSLPHRCCYCWTDARRLVQRVCLFIVGIFGQFVVWHLGHGTALRV